jgi:hypothetical protein
MDNGPLRSTTTSNTTTINTESERGYDQGGENGLLARTSGPVCSSPVRDPALLALAQAGVKPPQR